MNLFDLIREDIDRFKLNDRNNKFKVIFFTLGFWAVLNYRFSRQVYEKVHVPVLRQILLGFMYLWRKWIEVRTHIYLPWTASIGRGLHIAHFGTIILHPDSVIGDYCTLSQGVTLGMKTGGKNPGVPKIGNRVYIAPNAVLIGGITVGADVLIGAGSVVGADVPERGIVGGNPARVISHRGSFDYIRYSGMEEDTSRRQSMELAELKIEAI